MPVCLGHAQNGKIESAAIVKIKLAGLVDDGLGIDSCAKFRPPTGIPPYSGFGRKGEQMGDFSSTATRATPSRHADAQIHDLVRTQFHRGAAGNDFACVQFHRGNALKGHANFGGICRVVGCGEGFAGGIPPNWRPPRNQPALPGTFTCRGCRLPFSASRSTWAMTMPPLLCRPWQWPALRV